MGCVCTHGVIVCLGRDGSIGVEGETLCGMVCVWRDGRVCVLRLGRGCLCGGRDCFVYLCVKGDMGVGGERQGEWWGETAMCVWRERCVYVCVCV